MKKLLLLFLISIAALAQSPPVGPINITSSQCATISVGDKGGTTGVLVSGTWSGTLQPEVLINNIIANTQVTPSTSSTAQSTITANGIYYAAVAGSSQFQVCGNTVSSGTAVVYITMSTSGASAASKGSASAASGGSFAFYPGGTGGAVTKPAANTTLLWAFKAPTTVISSTRLGYWVNTADNTSNLNNLAIFDSGGNLVCQTGATAGTTLAPSTGGKQTLWTIACGPIIQNKEYYFAQTLVTSTMVLGGQSSAFSPLCATAPSSNSTTSNAVWTTPIGIPADSVTAACIAPYFVVY